ncbi:MAG: RsmG family class I SAM-dependent methyltransferase [Gaiellaceae bacterium]
MSDLLERWLEEVVSTPGLTAISDPDAARRMLVEDALRATDIVSSTPGPVVDVGSGGGSPGIPLALALPRRRFTLLEAERRKAAFLARVASGLPNADVVWGRAEAQPIETWGVALAKALAKPPVAAELTLPLVRIGGVAVLWVGASADRAHVERVASALSGRLEAELDGLLVLRKVGSTPAGFPRRPGMAKKRPLP